MGTQLAGNTMAAATLAHCGCVDVAAALLLAVPGAGAAVVGAKVSKRIPDAALQLMVSGALILCAPLLLKRAFSAPPEASPAPTPSSTPSPTSLLDPMSVLSAIERLEPALAARHAAAGVAMGFSTGALGVGAGPICMAYFTFATETPHAVALGTTNLAMLPALATGSLTHFLAGRVQLWMLPLLCAGTIVGGSLGASLAVRAPESWLQGALGVCLVLAGGTSARKALSRLL